MNWAVTYAENDKVIFTAQAVGHQVVLTGSPTGVFTPPNGIAYSPPPADLIGLNGLPVAAFAKVPFA